MPSGPLNITVSAVLLATLVLIGGCLSDTAAVDSGTGVPSDKASGNTPPTISGTPKTVILIGDAYEFQPTASDADGDELAFSIENKPRWAKFDANTGRLSGEVVLGDEGVYSGVRISVTDGENARALPAFSITVVQAANGSMTLSWTAPTENTDGTALTDLAGFFIYYGESPGSYTKSIRIDNPGITSYIVENMLPTTYYVVVTSFNTDGIESSYSNMVIKIVTP